MNEADDRNNGSTTDEDPELFKALLTDTATVKLSPKMRNKIAPYFLGGISTYDFGGVE